MQILWTLKGWMRRSSSQCAFQMNDELRLLTIGKNPEKFLRDWDATLLEHPRKPCYEDLYTILEGALRDYDPYKLDLHDHDINMTRLGDVPFREKYELLLSGFRTFLKVQKTCKM